MSVFRVVGVRRKDGIYEGKPFDNVYVYYVEEDPPLSGMIGGAVTPSEPAKIKWERIGEAFDGLITCMADLKELIGVPVDLRYDRYGHVCGMVPSMGSAVSD